MDDLQLALRIRAAVEGQDAIVRLGSSFVDVNKDIENLIRSLKAITGSSEGAASEFEFLRQTAEKYGLSILDLSHNYAKFTASAKGTALEGEASKKIFESVSAALSVLGGDTVQTQRAFNALSQMMSKTQIYAEELKGQLAEALPGALGTMAKALGVSTNQMLALMKAGQLSADALLPFAYELDNQYGKLSESSLTFSQAINKIKTAWSLLMKDIGDTGAWSALTGVLAGIGNHANVLAGLLGVALAGAIRSLVVAIGSWVAANATIITTMVSQTNILTAFKALLGITARETSVAAAAELQRAAANKVSAEASLVNAQTVELAARGTSRHAAALLELKAAQILMAKATDESTVAQLRFNAAQSVLSKGIGLLAGAGGLLATVVIGFTAMATVFNKQDEGLERLKKTTEDYTKALQELNTAKVLEQNLSAEQALQKAKQEEEIQADVIRKINLEIEALGGLGSANELVSVYLTRREEATRKLIDIEGQILSLEAKLAVGSNELASRYSSVAKSINEEKEAHDGLQATVDQEQASVDALTRQREEYFLLTENWSKITIQLEAATRRLTKAQGELAVNDAKTKALKEDLNKISEAYGKTIGATAEDVQTAIEGDQSYIATLDDKKRAIVENIQSLIKLDEQERISQARVKILKAEYDALAATARAKTDSALREADAIGDMVKRREVEIEQKRQEIKLNEIGIASVTAQISEIDSLIAKKQSLQSTNANEIEQNEKEIAKLQERRVERQKELDQRQANINALNAESVATEYANTIISESIAATQDVMKAATQEIIRLNEQYDAYKKEASGSELIGIQQTLTDNINKQSAIIAQSYTKMQASVSAVYKALGLDAQELATGIDFSTQHMIDAFGLLETDAKVSAQNVQKVFDSIIVKADTQEELKLLGLKLLALGTSSKISSAQVEQGLDAIETKAAELKTSIDPLNKAFENLGLGVPDKLKALSNELKTSYEILKESKAPVDVLQQAFLKYAETSLKAAASGAQIDLAQLKAQASALGLGNAFEELAKRTQNSSAEFDGIIEKYRRINELQGQNNETAKLVIQNVLALNEVDQLRNKNLGDEQALLNSLTEEEQLRLASIDEEINAAEQKIDIHKKEINELEALRSQGIQLGQEQTDRLNKLKEELSQDALNIAQLKIKKQYIEEQISSYESFINKIKEVSEVANRDLELQKNINAQQEKTIELKKQLVEQDGNLKRSRELALESAQKELENAKNQFEQDVKYINIADQKIEKMKREYEQGGRNDAQLGESIKQMELYRNQLVAVAQTSEQDVEIKERQRRQAEIMAGPVGELTQLYEDQARQHKISADASQRYYDIRVKESEGELRLAQIKGDALEIAKAEHKVNEDRIDQAQNIANVRAQEARDIENSVSVKVIAMAADGEWTKKDQEMEDQLRATAAAAKDAATEAQQHANQVLEEAKASEEAAKAQRELAEATAAAAERAGQLKAQSELVSGVLSGWAERLNALSPAARQAFDGFAEGADLASASVSQLSEASRQVDREIADIFKNGGLGGGGFAEWANKTALKALEIEQAFIGQKSAMLSALDALQLYEETGNMTAQVQSLLRTSTDSTINSFSLLDEQDLSGLRGAIDSAKDKMDSLRQSAEYALAAAQRALLQEQGDKLGVLKIEHQEKLLDLQRKLNEAKAAGDAKAIADLETAIRLENELYNLKARKERDKSDSTSTSTTSKSSGGGEYTLNLTAGGKSLTATTSSNPSDFLNAVAQARRSAA